MTPWTGSRQKPSHEEWSHELQTHRRKTRRLSPPDPRAAPEDARRAGGSRARTREGLHVPARGRRERAALRTVWRQGGSVRYSQHGPELSLLHVVGRRVQRRIFAPEQPRRVRRLLARYTREAAEVRGKPSLDVSHGVARGHHVR